MINKLLLLTLGLALSGSALRAQETPATPEGSKKPQIVVTEFVAAPNAAWPYDMKEMQGKTVAELKVKLSAQFEIVTEAPVVAQGHVYTLNGEVIAWRPGNAAKRALIGLGSGREAAEIHYWLTDETGKKVMDRKDTIRSEFWGNAFAGSVGQLAHPFADKISNRIRDAKLK